jgi:5-oxoprolinase (ATP-hydrolysing)
VAVRVDTHQRSAEIDFTGTSAQQINNFNAPTAVCMAAVLYVFRTLVDDDIRSTPVALPLKVIIPAVSMLNLSTRRRRWWQCGNLQLHHQRAVAALA